jgi:hypothetical protein
LQLRIGDALNCVGILRTTAVIFGPTFCSHGGVADWMLPSDFFVGAMPLSVHRLHTW